MPSAEDPPRGGSILDTHGCFALSGLNSAFEEIHVQATTTHSPRGVTHSLECHGTGPRPARRGGGRRGGGMARPGGGGMARPGRRRHDQTRDAPEPARDGAAGHAHEPAQAWRPNMAPANMGNMAQNRPNVGNMTRPTTLPGGIGGNRPGLGGNRPTPLPGPIGGNRPGGRRRTLPAAAIGPVEQLGRDCGGNRPTPLPGPIGGNRPGLGGGNRPGSAGNRPGGNGGGIRPGGGNSARRRMGGPGRRRPTPLGPAAVG